MISLLALMKRKSLTIMGVNTGTSIDGLDLSVINALAPKAGRGGNPPIKQLLHRSVSFPPELRAELLSMATNRSVRLEKVALLDEALGEFIGRACLKLMKFCAPTGIKIDCVASHGQTVRHHPQLTSIAGIAVRSTLQLGSPERIASATNRIVVSHFRQANTALGGEGAPITTEAVYYCLNNSQESRLLVNIGGIANYFYLPYRKTAAEVIARDVGPGNMLLDQAAQILFGLAYDKAGALAKSGTVNEKLLWALSNKTYFGQQGAGGQRSTGREQFGPRSIKKILRHAERLGVDKLSVLATLTELTALKIYQQTLPLLSDDKRLSVIYLSGGGAKNTYLLQRLRALCRMRDSSWRVCSVSEIGINPDSFEATCYATLGWMCLKSLPALSSSATVPSACVGGQSKQQRISPILGRIIQPPQLGR